MEVPLIGKKSPHEIARKRPEKVRTEEFWKGLDTAKFLEENPRRALEITGEAISSGIENKSIADVVRRAIKSQNFQEVALQMGAHKSKRVANYLLREHRIGDEKITHRQLAKALAEAAPADKLVDVLARVENQRLQRELLAKYKQRVLSNPDAIKKITKYPNILERILELEWHAEMNEKQLRMLSDALSKGNPAEMAKILANTLEKDIRTPEAAKNTVIILRNIMSGVAGNPLAAEGILKIYDKIKAHVFSEKRKNIEFGKAFLELGGESTVAFLAKAAHQKYRQGAHDEMAEIAYEGAWLAKEYLKHVKLQNIDEKEAKERAAKYAQGIVKLTDPQIHSNMDYRKRKEVKQQIRRLVEELSNHKILEHMQDTQIRALGRNLAQFHDHDIVLPVAEAIARGGSQKHAKLLKAYLGAYGNTNHARSAFLEILERLEGRLGRELSDNELRNLVRAVNVREYIPSALWKKHGQQQEK